MKKNVIILIVVIVFVAFVDVAFLILKNQKPVEESMDNKQITNRYVCYKEIDSYVNEDTGISLKGNEVYSFYVLKDQSLSADISRTNMLFNTLEDLNTYYAYLKNTYHYTEDSQNFFEIDETTLTLSYMHRGLYGSAITNLQEYLDSLINEGYRCEESELDGTEER